MAARKKDTQINLIPEVGFAATTMGRVLTWMLSSFRIIVIVTEMIVMIAFLSRFWLDAKNTDLTELVLQKQAVIAASSDFEKEFKFAQKRLAIFSELAVDKGILSDTLDTVTKRLPPDVFLNSIFFTQEGLINIAGLSPSERSIQQFTVDLGASDQIESVKLLGINPIPGGDPSLMAFKVELSLKNKTSK